MSDDETVVRCIVSGRVQGVWYRASTKNKAVELGLRGLYSCSEDREAAFYNELVLIRAAELEAFITLMWDRDYRTKLQQEAHDKLNNANGEVSQQEAQKLVDVLEEGRLSESRLLRSTFGALGGLAQEEMFPDSGFIHLAEELSRLVVDLEPKITIEDRIWLSEELEHLAATRPHLKSSEKLIELALSLD